MHDFAAAGTSNSRTTGSIGISISAGGAHGFAFLGAVKALNDNGHLNALRALAGASAGSVIASILASEVNQKILEQGPNINIQSAIDDGISLVMELFEKAARNGSDLKALTMGTSHDPSFGPLFKSIARMWGQPDPVNKWNLENFSDYLNPEAVSLGPIDLFIGLTKYMESAKIASHVVANDARPSVIAASCAYNEALKIDGTLYTDGCFTKAAPVSPLIDDAQCGRVFMIGETTNLRPVLRHQTQARIAENSAHAVPHFEGHSLRVQREYPKVEIIYCGIPLPDSDRSRMDITRSSFRKLFDVGYQTTKSMIDRGFLAPEARLEADRVPA